MGAQAGAWVSVSGVLKRRGRADRSFTVPPTVSPAAVANAATFVMGGNTYTAQSPDQSWNLAVDADPSPTYLRVELRYGDRWANDIANFPNDARERCEVRTTVNLPFNTDVWSAGSLRITQPVALKPGEYNIVTQFIQDPPAGEAGGMTALVFSLQDGVLYFFYRGDTADVTTVRPPEMTAGSVDWTPYYGQWVNLVTRARFSNSTANGELDVWLNGTKILSLTGLTMGFNNPTGPYFKTGLYRSGWTSTLIVEWANREMGTASLASRITSPLAVPA